MKDIEKLDEIPNLCKRSEEELETDDFKNSEEIIKNFTENLLLNQTNTRNMCIIVLWGQFYMQ